MSTDLLRIHQSVLHGTPYNSISQFYEYYAGTTPDAKFGSSCGFQALEVGRRLRLEGVESVRFLVDGRHAATVCEHEGRTYLFDPYLLHLEPIDLTAIAESGTSLELSAYPFVELADGSRKPSLLRARYSRSAATVSLEYLRPDPSTGRYQLSRYFRLSLASAITEAPSADAIRSMLYHAEQNNLSVRVIDPEDGTIRDLVYPICYYHGDPEILASRLLVRRSDGAIIEAHDRKRFDGEVARMASTIGVSVDELLAFVLDGVAIYERHAPETIPYAPYNDYRPTSFLDVVRAGEQAEIIAGRLVAEKNAGRPSLKATGTSPGAHVEEKHA
jgi:hypothetical protein